MGLLDFFKSKKVFEKKTENQSLMHSFIVSQPHDDSFQDENPNGTGEFGLEKTNPIPVYGIDNLGTYMDKLRYSSSESGENTYYPVTYLRTNDSDSSSIGSNKPKIEPICSGTSSPNISGTIDVYNLYSIKGKKMAKLYVNPYSLKVSNKVPKGFFHIDEIS